MGTESIASRVVGATTRIARMERGSVRS